MKSYSVVVIVSGAVCVPVDADNEEEAMKIAIEEVNEYDFGALEGVDWEAGDCWEELT